MFVGGTPTPESSYCSFPRRLASSHQTRELVWSEAFGCRQKATSHQLHQAGALMELLSGRKIHLILGSSGVLVPLVYRSHATTNHPSSWGSPCKVGINQTCGVDGCYCDVLSDLLCVEPPLPKQICVKARLRGWKCVGGSVHLVLVGYMLAI